MLTGSISDLRAQRRFVRFWLARLSGTTANQMLMVALGWQICDITSSAWDLGLVQAAARRAGAGPTGCRLRAHRVRFLLNAEYLTRSKPL